MKLYNFENWHEADVLQIGRALCRICRYGGMVPWWWSVGRHSVAVSIQAQLQGLSVEAQLWALLHDGHEVIVGDWPRPVLKHFGQFEEFDRANANLRDGLDRTLQRNVFGYELARNVIDEVNQIDHAQPLLELAMFQTVDDPGHNEHSDFEKWKHRYDSLTVPG